MIDLSSQVYFLRLGFYEHLVKMLINEQIYDIILSANDAMNKYTLVKE